MNLKRKHGFVQPESNRLPASLVSFSTFVLELLCFVLGMNVRLCKILLLMILFLLIDLPCAHDSSVYNVQINRMFSDAAS